MITFDTDTITMVLLRDVGWENIQAGTLKIDKLEPTAPMTQSGQETYGFSCVHDSGDTITGRLTALLAVRCA